MAIDDFALKPVMGSSRGACVLTEPTHVRQIRVWTSGTQLTQGLHHTQLQVIHFETLLRRRAQPDFESADKRLKKAR